MKTALITGASHGIGKAIAERFAREKYRIFLNCRSSQRELADYAGKLSDQYGILCVPLVCDVSDHRQVASMFEEIHSMNGQIDVLVNNAGISHIGLLQDMEIEDWNRIINTNLTSVFSCCKFAIPEMIRKKSGKIINISSVWGIAGASCEAAYSASKGGVNALTKALAKELAPSNIQVNAVACGVIDTRMNQCFDAEERAALAEEIPAGRFGRPEEIADFVYQLANGHDYLTGQVITMDGGFL